MSAIVEVRGLRLAVPTAAGTLAALRGVDLTVEAGRTLGLVGESGSGKSLTALSLLGLQPRAATVSADTLSIGGIDIRGRGEKALAREVRGVVGTMIFQEPMTSLNPVVTVGRQLVEAATVHGLMPASAARRRAIELLERVGIAGAASRLAQYPHQFSGGQRQRLMIAMALMTRPRLLIADEPTTALDVTVQAEILRLLADLRAEFGMALVLVTHNLAVVSRVADAVAVMYAGQVVEQAPVADLFRDPRHPYTRGLLAALPDAERHRPGMRLGAIPGVVPSLIGAIEGCAFAPRCALAREACRAAPPPILSAGPGRSHRCVDLDPATVAVETTAAPVATGDSAPVAMIEAAGLERRYRVSRGLFRPAATLTAVGGVDLTLVRGETLALVGESGCGKSTLARLLLGLEAPDAGDLRLAGRPLATIAPRERAQLIEPVFQDPRGSLNPRRTVAEIIRRPLDVHGVGAAREREAVVLAAMEDVGLPRRLFHAHVNQLSGGQRQRVAIARALVLQPTILLCDEPTSALDVSVQAQILNLLADLRAARGLSIMLVTHDLSVVRHVADRVAVMYLGRIVEVDATQAIFATPRHPYTRALIESAVTLAPGAGIGRARIGPGFPDPLRQAPGCPFQPRCLDALAVCASVRPALAPTGTGAAACHLVAERPAATA
ncbi:MAG: dipeptide ABC transporter ATP-binding protein [Alphaproteobacteria bacterium]